jgi:hypothetical protein
MAPPPKDDVNGLLEPFACDFCARSESHWMALMARAQPVYSFKTKLAATLNPTAKAWEQPIGIGLCPPLYNHRDASRGRDAFLSYKPHSSIKPVATFLKCLRL